ncbi:MAG: hypothetical protein L7S44_02125 [Flavobacteriaceae bacterium]|nr:hypothetical protein [Flavobacteriaceae bacterium]
MRTKTTTREQTWNKEKNFPLKLYLYENGYKEAYEKIKILEHSKIIKHGYELSDDPNIIKIIDDYLKE